MFNPSGMLLGVFEKFQLNFQLDLFMMFWAGSLPSKAFASSPYTSLTCSKYLEGSLHQAVCVGKKKERLRNTSIRMYVTKCKKRGDFFKWISKSSWNTVIEPDGETCNLFPELSKNFSANFSVLETRITGHFSYFAPNGPYRPWRKFVLKPWKLALFAPVTDYLKSLLPFVFV